MKKDQILETINNEQYGNLTLPMMYEVEKDLSTDDFVRYNMLVNARKKQPLTGWLLWALLGGFGADLIYLGLEEDRLVAFILLIVGWVLAYFVIGIFIIIGVRIWSAFILNKGLKASEIKTKAIVYKEMFM